MKELVPMDERYGVFADMKDTARADSRYVAEVFCKNHRDVLRKIEALIADDSGLSEGFVKRNFALNNYTDNYNRKHKAYAMTRDGFTMLVMGFTGKRAMAFKEAYIRRFNEMESFIKTLADTRKDFPKLTDQIKLVNPDAKPYHYSNECDMINRIVLGMSAKQYREVHNIPKGESIRPYLAEDQVEMLNALQDIDYGLLLGVPDFQQRKRQLEWWAMTHSKQAIAE